MQTSASNSYQPEEVNNHVHSNYSFSPYSPTQITEAAVEAGLKTVGLMDHDAIAGAPEFLEAAFKTNAASLHTRRCVAIKEVNVNELP